MGGSLLVSDHRVVAAVAFPIVELLEELVSVGTFTSEHLSDVTNLLAQRLRIDPMFLVVGHLDIATTICFVDGDLHGISDLVRVHDDLTVDVTSGAANGLDKGPFRTQKALLVGVEDRHQGNLREIESLS